MDDKYKTFFPRLVAGIVDGAVLSPVTFPTAVLIGYGPTAIAVGWLVLTFPVAWSYTAFCHGRWGKTLGKHVMGIEVVRADGAGVIGYKRALTRDSGSIVLGALGVMVMVQLVLDGDRDAFRIFHPPAPPEYDPETPPSLGQIYRDTFATAYPNLQVVLFNVINSVWFLAEMITMLTNPRRRALHDLIGGTVVVKTGEHDVLPAEPSRAIPAPAPPSQQPSVSLTKDRQRRPGRGW